MKIRKRLTALPLTALVPLALHAQQTLDHGDAAAARASGQQNMRLSEKANCLA